MKISIILTMILLLSSLSFAQNIYSETFEGCVTDQFALESDSTDAGLDPNMFIEKLVEHLGNKITKKLKGELRIQIIVDKNGNSCVLSVQNKTNVKTSKLNLKQWIDSEIIWTPPSQKVSAQIVLDFHKGKVGYLRVGMNGKHGWHVLAE